MPKISEEKLRSVEGKTFGELFVIKVLPLVGKKRMWLCKCSCGVIKEFNQNNVKSGKSKCCGCAPTHICQECGKGFTRRKRPFCSRECYDKIRDRLHMEKAEERFLKKVKKTDGCWEWIGGKRGIGYGAIYFEKRSQPAHVVSYKLYIGPVANGMNICHKCDNPSCVRPDHLFMGTQQDNVDDMMRKGRHKTNPYTKHTKFRKSWWPFITQLRELGWGYDVIGINFGVSGDCIRQAVIGETIHHHD